MPSPATARPQVVAPNGRVYPFAEVHGSVLSSPWQRMLQLVFCNLPAGCCCRRNCLWLCLKLLLCGDVEANPGPVGPLDIAATSARLATWMHASDGSSEPRSYCLSLVDPCGQQWLAPRSGSVPGGLLQRSHDAVCCWALFACAHDIHTQVLVPAAWAPPPPDWYFCAESGFWVDLLHACAAGPRAADSAAALQQAYVILALFAMLGDFLLTDCIRVAASLHQAYPVFVQFLAAACPASQSQPRHAVKRRKSCVADTCSLPVAADPAALAAEVRQLYVAAAADLALNSTVGGCDRRVAAAANSLVEQLSVSAALAAGVHVSDQAALLRVAAARPAPALRRACHDPMCMQPSSKPVNGCSSCL